jgi:hypothetical protein
MAYIHRATLKSSSSSSSSSSRRTTNGWCCTCCYHVILCGLVLIGLHTVVTKLVGNDETSRIPERIDQSTQTVSSGGGSNIKEIKHVNQELLWDSSTATVMGMATGYGVQEYRYFVGSLRKSGYQGHIMLGVDPDMRPGVEDYLTKMNVTMLRIKKIPCVTQILKDVDEANSHAKEVSTCIDPYPDVKIRWGRFPFLRDALINCASCTGPVLITDVRDTIVQRDPFGDGAPPVTGLQVFQEFRHMKTDNWLVSWPVEKCKGKIEAIQNQPMLCSGTTIATREMAIGYLNAMYEEMKVWMKDPNCCCNGINGDDQSIHNYLFYSGGFNHLHVQSFPPRTGAIVNTVGNQASLISTARLEARKRMTNLTIEQQHDDPFDGADEASGQWLGLHFDLTDPHGYFIEYDGSYSRVVHQYDRFGQQIMRWLNQHGPGKLYD